MIKEANFKRLYQSFDKSLNWLNSQLKDNGSYGDNVKDLASYYKSPYLFYISGKLKEPPAFTCFDQTVEIALWLREISALLFS